jgi:elongation factor G
MIESLRVVDGAVIVVGAVSGVSVGTEKAWDYCKEYNVPKLIFVNQMDRENVHYEKVLEELEGKYGTAITPAGAHNERRSFYRPSRRGKYESLGFYRKGLPKEIPIPDDLS